MIYRRGLFMEDFSTEVAKKYNFYVVFILDPTPLSCFWKKTLKLIKNIKM